MKTKKKKLLSAIVLPLAFIWLAYFFTSDGFEIVCDLEKPRLFPEKYFYFFIRALVYALVGAASYLVLSGVTTYEKRITSLCGYAVLLCADFFKHIIFFDIREYCFAFVWSSAVFVGAYFIKKRFSSADETAGLLFFPFLLFAGFEAYLTLGIYLLN